MVDVMTTTIIDRPVEEVAPYASDPDNAVKWYNNISAVQWRSKKPLQKGSEIAFKANFLGRDLSYVYKIDEYVPGERLVMRTSYGPFLMETSYMWEKVNSTKTKMTLRNRGNPKGFSKFFSPFMSLAMKTANRKDLQQLKHLLEKK